MAAACVLAAINGEYLDTDSPDVTARAVVGGAIIVEAAHDLKLLRIGFYEVFKNKD